MDASLAELVRRRAAYRCEYCGLPDAVSSIAFEIDHIIARKHGGNTSADNLALSCFYCNSQKGPNIAGIDPDTGALSRLFHPRKDRWTDHFRWNGAFLCGTSSVGRTTIVVLGINAWDFVLLRAALISDELFPADVD